MARKVFLSFLGKSIYRPTYYIDRNIQKEDGISENRFVQVATISNYCRDFKEDDKIFILTTNEALHNWEEAKHKSFSGDWVLYDSLEKSIGEIGLKVKAENINIKDGESTEELWEVFQTIYDLIEERDELIFDITHGFRTLPMFVVVFLNYAKLLKNVKVQGIYYGNFEARYKFGDKEFSPIWNLESFVALQDWTNAANIFLKTGSAISMADLIREKKNRSLKDGLIQFSKFILVNRGVEILKGDKIVKLSNDLDELIQSDVKPEEKPLVPILEKVKEEFIAYKEDNVINGFLAVKWAIKNGLIQQGATMLEEAVTTFVLYDIGQGLEVQNPEIRLVTSAAIVLNTDVEYHFTIPPLFSDNENKSDRNRREKLEQKLLWEKKYVDVIRNLPYKEQLAQVVTNIKNSIRNDVNHAGFRKDPQNYNSLKKSLSNRYQEIQKLLKEINKLEIPNL